MRPLSLTPCLLLLLAGAAAPLSAEEVLNDERFLVVTRDGDQHVGALHFVWTTFRVVDGPEGVSSEQDEVEEEDERSGRGGRRGGFGLGHAFSLLRTVASGDPASDLSSIDRIVGEDGGVFRALPRTVESPRLDEIGYHADYGGLALPFRAVEGWTCARVDERSLVLVRRDHADEIVGVFRLSVHRYGDGESTDLELDEEAVDVDAAVRDEDRERFAVVRTREKRSSVLTDGSPVLLVVREGTEEWTDAPLAVEVAIWKQGPFLPRVDLLVRGDERERLREEGRELRGAVQFTRDAPAPTRREAERSPEDDPQEPEPPDERGRGGRGGRDGRGAGSLTRLAPPLEDDDSPYLVDGRYVHPGLGVEFRGELPDGWRFLRADDHGLLAAHFPEGRWTELGAVGLTVLDGTVAAAEPAAWLAERYVLPGSEGRPPRPDRVRIGAQPGFMVEDEEDGGRGTAVQQRFFLEDRGRTVVITTYGVGSGNQGEKLLKPLSRWLKGLKLSTPSG